MGYPTVCFGNVTEPIPSCLHLLGLPTSGCDLKAWLVPATQIRFLEVGVANY